MKTFARLIGYLSCFFGVHFTCAQIEVNGAAQFKVLADSAQRIKTPMMGYRVVLGFDSDKSLIDSLKLSFQEKNPRIEAYIIYEPPNFRFVVGDFRTEIEALGLVKKLPPEYPIMLVQKMPINLPRID